ncbi:hypothetical protein [Rhizobium sp. S163]|uniref:hypothetical protein n=1 Tax=Rhizobium sp. S163 TaxID=3055039 RepID=UPI0025A9B4BC|nr:hypothetical protein [Rhizobium sp. S163]MDM9647721.1 hypothetical protein [Rhizobium sp. S163]
MNCQQLKPSSAIVDFRKSIVSLFQAGRVVTPTAMADAIAGINTCLALAREYEEEMAIIERAITRSEPVVIKWDMGREAPPLRLIISNRPVP